MTGTKTNERPGTRAVHRYARVTAPKVREVLDLIRGETFDEAVAILEFTDRAVARDVLKLLESAAANAAQAAGLAGIVHGRDREEYFSTLRVVACFADQGPTLKRWRPRARGRATRILKRTSHITVIVERMSDDELEALATRTQSKASAAGRPASTDRKRRVERSQRKQAQKEAAAAEAEHDHDHDHDHDHEGHDDAAPAADIEHAAVTDDAATDDGEDADIASASADDTVAADTGASDTVAADTVAADTVAEAAPDTDEAPAEPDDEPDEDSEGKND